MGEVAFKDFKSAKLFNQQASMRFAGQVLPNFPLRTNHHDYNTLIILYGINVRPGDKRYKTVYEQSKSCYPETNKNEVAASYFFQQRYSCPTARYSKKQDELQLIFPIYKDTKHYFCCHLPGALAQEMIETEIDVMTQHIHSFQMDKNYKCQDLSLRLAQNIMTTNAILANNFETITGRKIATPFSKTYAKETGEVFKDNQFDLLVCPLLANSYFSNSGGACTDNGAAPQALLTEQTKKFGTRIKEQRLKNWVIANS